MTVMYVGETEWSLKACFLEHWRKSSVGHEVSQHVHVDRPEHEASLDKVKILSVENKKFDRCVREAIYTCVAKPSLSNDGGSYLLPAVWTNLTWEMLQW